MAAGNGIVEMAEWYGGYGRYMRVKHANSYSHRLCASEPLCARHQARARACGRAR